jgi:signal transduction histidine kinase
MEQIVKELIDELPFEIAARLPIQLGRQSISSSLVAICELIKNSYDADSTKVDLEFISKDSQSYDTLVIQDNGEGMSYEDIQKNWLIIGTSHKTQYEISKYGNRVYTGAKGLGRLGADRLCRKLIMQTKLSTDPFLIELEIEWHAYENTDKPLSQIKHKIYKVQSPASDEFGSFPKQQQSGTRIILQGLKDNWDEKFLKDLKKELSLLVSPFKEAQDFQISIHSNLHEVNGSVASSDVVDYARWYVEATLDEDIVDASFTYGPDGRKFELSKIVWRDWAKDRPETPSSGPLRFKMYFIPWDAPGLKSVDFSRRNWRDFMDANQGIRIYRDHFRVRPYGEPTGRGDWLDLGIRRAKSPGGVKQGGWRVGPHQVIGAVFIGRRENHLLEDQTNREGIVESDAFFDMRAFCTKVIQHFEHYAHLVAKEEDSSTTTEDLKKSAKDALDQTTKVVEDLKENIRKKSPEQQDNTPDLLNRIVDVEKKLAEASARSSELEAHLEQKAEELEHEKDTLANLASLGILTVCFGHEAKEFTNLALANAQSLKRSFEGGKFMLTSPHDEEFSACLNRIISTTGFVRNFASFALSNIKPDKRKRRVIDIGMTAKNVFNALRASLERQNIESSVDVESSTKVSAFEIDIESIFVNLISNSIWALRKTPNGSRVISVKVSTEYNSVNISFADSGCGLDAGTEEQIFEPMYSTRMDRKGYVEGTGMGLAIVKSFIDNHTDGDITAIAKGRLGGAEFNIKLPIKGI